VNCRCEVQTCLPRSGSNLKSGTPNQSLPCAAREEPAPDAGTAAAHNWEGGPIFPTIPNIKQKEQQASTEETTELARKKEEIRQQLLRGEIEENELELEVEEEAPTLEVGGSSISLGDMMGNMMPRRTRMRHVKVKEARKILTDQEAAKLIDNDAVQEEAIHRTEQNGIVFIDEIDKIAGNKAGNGPDVSREGVQRDILPIVEGCTVTTKYGPVKTDFMLFIAAGAFHVSKVSDLIPELQGRFPVHVQLQSLSRDDFRQILTVPENALTKQYCALLEVDKVLLKFDDSAIDAIAEAACNANENAEDIGARRLHAIFEQLLEDVSFNAGDENMPPFELMIDRKYVNEHLRNENKPMDIRKYIL
jgi:ATP-dependent HslUV protease ATP-binding subunit HslU